MFYCRDASRGNTNRDSLTSVCLTQSRIFAKRHVGKVIVSEYLPANKLFSNGKMSYALYAGRRGYVGEQNLIDMVLVCDVMNVDRILNFKDLKFITDDAH